MRYTNAHAEESHDPVRVPLDSKEERAVVCCIMWHPENTKMIPTAAVCSEDLETAADCSVIIMNVMDHDEANVLCCYWR